MGRLIDGQWTKTSIITSDDRGAYDRIPRSFREIIAESCLLYTSPSPRDKRQSRMPSSA